MMRIKSLALAKYGSVTGFARAMSWSVSKASRILGGAQDPGLSDIREMVSAMKLSESQVLDIFFGV